MPPESTLAQARLVPSHATLLLIVNGVFELPEELAGDVALEAALDVSVAFLLGSAAFGVGLGDGVVTEAVYHDDVQGPVELTVTEAAEAVLVGQARTRWDRCDAGELGERGLVAASAGMRPRAQDVRGHDRADTELGEQVRTPRLDDRGDRGLVRVGFGLQDVVASSQVA